MFIIELVAGSPGVLYSFSETSLAPEILQQGSALNFIIEMEVDEGLLNEGGLQMS